MVGYDWKKVIGYQYGLEYDWKKLPSKNRKAFSSKSEEAYVFLPQSWKWKNGMSPILVSFHLG